MSPEFLYDYRRQVSAVLTAAAVAVAVMLPVRRLLQKIIEPEPAKPLPMTIELTVAEPPVPQPPPVAVPIQPRARQEPAHLPRPQPAPKVVRPEPVVQAEPAAPSVTAPAAVATPADPALVAVPHPVPAPVATPSPVPPPTNPQADQRYEAALKNYIESRKSYPTSRQASMEKPEGVAYMCVRLNRGGGLLEASVRSSSGSALLDQAARRLLAGLSYPPFEEMAFRGQEEHEFCVRLKYQAPQG